MFATTKSVYIHRSPIISRTAQSSGITYIRAVSKCSHSAQNAAGILMSELFHNTATSSAKHAVSKNNSCLFAITALKHSLSCRHYSRESTPNPQAPDTFSNLYEATMVIIFRRDRPATAVATHRPLVLILFL